MSHRKLFLALGLISFLGSVLADDYHIGELVFHNLESKLDEATIQDQLLVYRGSDGSAVFLYHLADRASCCKIFRSYYEDMMKNDEDGQIEVIFEGQTRKYDLPAFEQVKHIDRGEVNKLITETNQGDPKDGFIHKLIKDSEDGLGVKTSEALQSLEITELVKAPLIPCNTFCATRRTRMETTQVFLHHEEKSPKSKKAKRPIWTDEYTYSVILPKAKKQEEKKPEEAQKESGHDPHGTGQTAHVKPGTTGVLNGVNVDSTYKIVQPDQTDPIEKEVKSLLRMAL